uniref:Uncharacterized protein n=1 Tax=Rhizophora mucronata TaxID=61149 RepID=A0A2P2PVN3_RHIMU
MGGEAEESAFTSDKSEHSLQRTGNYITALFLFLFSVVFQIADGEREREMEIPDW